MSKFTEDIICIKEQIKFARMNAGLTLESAAEKAGIEIHQWRHVEYTWKGRSLPHYFKDICHAVDLDPVEVLIDSGYL